MLPLAYLGAFKAYRGKWLLEIVLLLPLVLPPTIVGLYLLLLFGRQGPLGFLSHSIIFTLAGASFATTIVVLPLLYQGLKGAMISVPRSIIEIGQTLSANRREILFKLILPNCWPAILASILLAFCRALGEFGASLMVAGYIPGQTDTLANSIYFAIQEGDNRGAILLSLVTIGLGLFFLLLITILTRRKRSLL